MTGQFNPNQRGLTKLNVDTYYVQILDRKIPQMFKEDKEYLEIRGVNRPFMALFRKGVYMSIVRDFDNKIRENENDI